MNRKDIEIFDGKYDEERIPFLITPSTDYDKAVNGELIYNKDTGEFYIKKEGSDIQIGFKFIEKLLDKKMYELRNGPNMEGITLADLYNRYLKIKEWKETMSNIDGSDDINSLQKIIYMFNDMTVNDPSLVELLNNKVDIEEDKQLSEEDFTDELYHKLMSIQEGANKYVHPKAKQCEYINAVTSVNGYTDKHIILTAKDFGLENIDLNANFYEHPVNQQCNCQGILSVNGKTGDVTIGREDIGLGSVVDAEIYDGKGLPMFVDDKYVTPALIKVIKDKVVQYLYPRLHMSDISKYTEEFLKENTI